jgi:hypothetical protein
MQDFLRVAREGNACSPLAGTLVRQPADHYPTFKVGSQRLAAGFSFLSHFMG